MIFLFLFFLFTKNISKHTRKKYNKTPGIYQPASTAIKIEVYMSHLSPICFYFFWNILKQISDIFSFYSTYFKRSYSYIVTILSFHLLRNKQKLLHTV